MWEWAVVLDYDDADDMSTLEKSTTAPVKAIMMIILLVLFITGALWLTQDAFKQGEQVAVSVENTTEFVEKINNVEVSLEKSVVVVDRQSVYINKLIIKSNKPVDLKIKLNAESSCIKFVDSNSNELTLTASLMTEVPIKIPPVNCYLKSQRVYVEVYKVDNEGNEKLVKKLQFTVLVDLSTYLNVFPRDRASITGVFDIMNYNASVSVYREFIETNNIISLQNDLLFYVETKINAPITIVGKVTFTPLETSVAQYYNNFYIHTMKNDNSVEFLMGLEPGVFYFAEKSVTKGFWLLGIPQVRTGGYIVTVDYYVLATDSTYEVLKKHFGDSTSDVVFFKPFQLEDAGMKEKEFDEWLKKNALARKRYTYSLISLNEVGFSSWTSIALFVPYWIDYSGSWLQAINQKKEMYILGLLDTEGSLTPSPPLETAPMLSNYELKTFKDMRYVCCSVGRDVFLFDYSSRATVEDSPLIFVREMLYKQGDYYVILRKMLLNEHAVNVDFQNYASFTDSVFKTILKIRKSNEDIYSPNLLPLLFFEDSIPLYLRTDRIDKDSVKLSDVKLYVCVADRPFESKYLEESFVKNSLSKFEDVPGDYFSCAESPEKRYKLVDVSSQQTEFSLLVKKYTIKTAFLVAWQVPSTSGIDYIRRWFYGHDLACKINHVGLAGLLSRPSLDKFVFILLKPECSEKSEYLTVFYTYTLKIKTKNGRSFNIRVFGGLYYPLDLARERALTELEHQLKEHPDLLSNETEENNTTIDNSTITENH